MACTYTEHRSPGGSQQCVSLNHKKKHNGCTDEEILHGKKKKKSPDGEAVINEQIMASANDNKLMMII